MGAVDMCSKGGCRGLMQVRMLMLMLMLMMNVQVLRRCCRALGLRDCGPWAVRVGELGRR